MVVAAATVVVKIVAATLVAVQFFITEDIN